MSADLAALPRPRPQGAGTDDFWRYLGPAFPDGAGWDPGTETLAPPPGHPLPGYRLCLVRGWAGQGRVPGGFCGTCRKARRESSLSDGEFIAAGPARDRHCGEVICSAGDCPRPVRTRRLQLCYTHEHRRRTPGLPLEDFLRHPRAEPLPGFGPCKVAVCTRQAHARRGLCRPHDVRWREQHRAGLAEAADFGAWCRSSAPVASGHEAVMRGLAPLVQAQILSGLQERCRQGALTLLPGLRIICRRLLAVSAGTIAGFDDPRFDRRHRALARDLQQAVLLAGTSPEDEQRKDIWNTVVLGHGRRRVIDFTGISQPWLREAVKQWTAGELPARRGDHATAILQDHVRRAGELPASLRLHRDDHGGDPPALGRSDIIAFPSRVKHRQATGQMSSWRRSATCRQAAMILRECRALGLGRPGQPMSGLADDFAVRRDDIPQQAADDEPGRALPAGVLNQLITALPLLEQSAGPALRAAAELLMDTGRRPTEVCKLGWDCLDQAAESLTAARRRDSTRRRQRVLSTLDQMAAAGQEISVSAVARTAGVDRSFLYRHHDLRAQIHARATAPAGSTASTAASKQSPLADLANLREQNQRLRRQNTDLTARLSEVPGEEVFRASGIGRTDETETLRTRTGQLEQQELDLRQEPEERTGDLSAARAANRDLMALANRKPAGPA